MLLMPEWQGVRTSAAWMPAFAGMTSNNYGDELRAGHSVNADPASIRDGDGAAGIAATISGG